MTPLERTRVTAKERHRRHANPFSLIHEPAKLDVMAVYGREAPIALDIGFGEGAFAVELARRHPEWNVLGLEIREHLVRFLNDGAAARGLRNLHGVLANASAHLGTILSDRSVGFIAINFPDPCFKRRHMKRRVLSPAWLEAIAPKLMPGAELHAKSDFEPIAREMAKILDRSEKWKVIVPFAADSESTTGIMTEREVKHSGRGEPIYRMAYRYEPGGTSAP